MSEPIVITRDKVKRGWSDLEPKIAIALVAGFLAIIALIIAAQLGVTLPASVAQVASIAFVLLAGYLTPSAGTVVTRRTDTTTTTEAHSAPTVTTITAPVTVQRTPESTPVQDTEPGAFTKVLEPAQTEIVPDQSNVETEIVPTPSYSRGQSILDQLRSQSQSDH